MNELGVALVLILVVLLALSILSSNRSAPVAQPHSGPATRGPTAPTPITPADDPEAPPGGAPYKLSQLFPEVPWRSIAAKSTERSAWFVTYGSHPPTIEMTRTLMEPQPSYLGLSLITALRIPYDESSWFAFHWGRWVLQRQSKSASPSGQ